MKHYNFTLSWKNTKILYENLKNLERIFAYIIKEISKRT